MPSTQLPATNRARRRRGLRILRRPAVLAKVQFCEASLDNAMEHDGFPRPIAIGPRAVGWVEYQIDDWLETRIAQRDDTTIGVALRRARRPAPVQRLLAARGEPPLQLPGAAASTGPQARIST